MNINNIELLKFNKVSLPQFTERINKAKGYVEFGSDNLFPQYINSLLAKSPLHSSIVTQKSRMIGGFGFNKINLNPKAMMFLKNSRNEYDLDEILYRCAYDLEVYGAFALNPIWSKDRQTISEINYVDVSKIRIQSPDEENKYPMIENYWVSDGWENIRKFEPILYSGFSTRSKKKASQIWYIKDQRGGQEYYGIPEYISAIRWMETDWLISNFHMNNINNNFAISSIMNVPSNGASDDQKFAMANKIRNEITGTDNAGIGFIHFPDGPEDKIEIQPIDMNNSDGRFIILKEQSEQSILFAHRVSHPVLFIGDVMSPGSIGGKSEILEALELFQNAYLTPKQNILEKVFNRLGRINEIGDNLIVNKYSQQFKNVDTSISDLLSILTSNNQELLTPDKKYWMLVQSGYNHEISAKLTGYEEGNVRNNVKSVDPIPSMNGIKK